MLEIVVNTMRGSYPVIIERGIRKHLPENIPTDSTIAIITDENVSSLYRTEIENQFGNSNKPPFWITVKPGENSKSIETYSQIVEDLINHDFHRGGVIVGLGGGVVTDLAGFVAATFMRGVQWTAVPTTLLAQVDASIGGKTGIHHSEIKNVIGAFHQPSKVIVDPEFLKTLSKRQYLSGLAEVLKMSLLPGGEKFSTWENEFLKLVLNRDEESIVKILEESCAFKKRIVENDEFDIAGRIILNLGHTLGHALESAGEFEAYTHGEAVAIGILFISFMSNRNGDLSNEDFERIRDLIMPIVNRTAPLDLEWGKFHDIIFNDKKRTGSAVRWVYPMGIGKVAIREFDSIQIKQAWDIFETAYRKW